MENQNLELFKNEIKGKKVAVLGIGVSNIPAISYLYDLGAVLYAHDNKEVLPEACQEIASLPGITFELGEKAFTGLNEMDYILRSPGVKPFLPVIEEAVSHGVTLTSEIELFMQYCPCPVIGITGSAGKTTVTTLVSQLLKDANYHVWIGGNIGTPLFTKLDDIKKEDIVVLELSSFQLMTMSKSPNISLITNIYEDHLDYHRSFEEYVLAKTNILMHQKKGDICVLNLDSPFINSFEEMIEKNKLQCEVQHFSTKQTCQPGAYLKDNEIYLAKVDHTEKIVSVDEVKLMGEMNYGNICSALCLVASLVSADSMRKTLRAFKGVEHRLEYVDTKHGVSYYNDSIATTPGKAMAALTSFPQKIIVIAGGSDKNLEYQTFGEMVVAHAKQVILLGSTKEKIQKAIQEASKDQAMPIQIVESLEDAIHYASQIAVEGDVVAMIPASASFDMYPNYKERGKHFKRLVENLG